MIQLQYHQILAQCKVMLFSNTSLHYLQMGMHRCVQALAGSVLEQGTELLALKHSGFVSLLPELDVALTVK